MARQRWLFLLSISFKAVFSGYAVLSNPTCDFTLMATSATPPEYFTVDQLIDWYRVQTPNKPYFCYIGENGSKELISMSDYGKAIYRSIDIITSELPEQQNGCSTEIPLTVAFLSNSDWPTYTAFLYGHVFLTHPRIGRPVLPFLISPRNSAIAIAHLLKETQCSYVWAAEGPLSDLAEEAVAINTTDFRTQLKRFPSFHELYHVEPSNFPTCYDDSPIPLSTPMAIVHSSGSTSFPKVRPLTHGVFLQRGIHLHSTTHHQLAGEIFVVSPPPFHGMGLFMSGVAIRNNFTLAVNSPYAPPGSILSEEYLDLIKKINPNYVLTIPSFLEEWSRNPVAVELLKTRKAILWGGGPLNNEIGARLYDEGVPIRVLYGATEFGTVNNPLEGAIQEGHEWFRFRSNCDVALVKTDATDVYQLIVKESKHQGLTAHNTEVDGIPAFDTNDLIQRHPENHSLYRIAGRADDQIMLSTGEKTNPGPLEAIIKRNHHIKDVLMFGRGRPSNGILIQPVSFEEAEKLGLEGFRNLIWSSMEEANTYAPAHSRILKEMIIIASASEPFTYSSKETLKKGSILNAYADKIEALYKNVESSVHAEIPIPPGSHPDGGWTEEESREFVRNVLYTILKTESKGVIGDTDDIFGYGCDSLQATYIRNTLLHALRQVAPLPNIRNLPTSFVYQSPSIDSLSKLLAQASHSEVYQHISETREARKKRLDNLIHQYTTNWPKHTAQKEYGDEEIVLLTGSTGGLGSQLLAQLIQIDTVSKIYVLNRPGKKSSFERHVEAFEDRGNDVELLKLPKIVFAEGDTSLHGFGLDVNLLNDMKNSVTTIIHNAWNVNFNISLASFEPAIRGVRNLIDFALSSPYSNPPPLLFTSSIGTVKTWANVPPIEEAPIDSIDLLPNKGYGESKWISERILTIARTETCLQSVIIRVGQLSGGINGNWNVHEWFPSIITAGQMIGCLPEYDGVASFIPVHKAASVIIELRNAPISFAHIVHPRPIPWNQLIGFISEKLKLSIIPFADWVDQLAKLPNTEENLIKTQALHLLEFYKSAVPPEANSHINGSDQIQIKEVMGLPTFKTEETERVAETLKEKNLPSLTREDVVGWIGYWRTMGYLN